MWLEPRRESIRFWESIQEADLARTAGRASLKKRHLTPHLDYEYRLKGRKRGKEATDYKKGLQYDPHIVKMNKHSYVVGQG